MALTLEGSCHCGGVKFTVESAHPYPFNHCYCSICRKTAGGGGYAINLSAAAATLRVRGEKNVRVFRAKVKNPEDDRAWHSSAERRFCVRCGSALWIWDRTWPELLHPFASAIDTPLPKPPERTHLMLEFKAPWVELHAGPKDQKFRRYPEESIAQWHERLGLAREDERPTEPLRPKARKKATQASRRRRPPKKKSPAKASAPRSR